MTKSRKWPLVFADSFIIGFLGIFLLYKSSYQPKPVFDLLLAILPFLISWIFIGNQYSSFNLNIAFKKYLKKIILSWSISAILGQAIRFILNRIINQASFTLLGLFIDLILFSILFLSWRISLKLIFQLYSQSTIVRRLTIFSLIPIGIMTILLFTPYVYARITFTQDIYSSISVPSEKTGLVFGAGVYGNQHLSPILRNRVNTAADLYHRDKVQQIILSGSNDEVAAMVNALSNLEINDETLILDKQGLSTIDSCKNLNHLGVDHEVILVSQKYHLYRALFICNYLGVKSFGVRTNNNTFNPEFTLRRNAREIPATAWAFTQVTILKVFSNPQVIK
jgi:SanA protein